MSNLEKMVLLTSGDFFLPLEKNKRIGKGRLKD